MHIRVCRKALFLNPCTLLPSSIHAIDLFISAFVHTTEGACSFRRHDKIHDIRVGWGICVSLYLLYVCDIVDLHETGFIHMPSYMHYLDLSLLHLVRYLEIKKTPILYDWEDSKVKIYRIWDHLSWVALFAVPFCAALVGIEVDIEEDNCACMSWHVKLGREVPLLHLAGEQGFIFECSCSSCSSS